MGIFPNDIIIAGPVELISRLHGDSRENSWRETVVKNSRLSHRIRNVNVSPFLNFL